jgi:hypothetical protein
VDSDKEKGKSFEIKFKPSTGKHTITATVDGKHASGSPMTISTQLYKEPMILGIFFN